MRALIVNLGVALGAYLAAGFLFAVAFQAVGLRRLDPAARGAGWVFRLLVTPGVIALWPVLLRRWRTAQIRGSDAVPEPSVARARQLRTVHGWVWRILLVVGPLILGVALASRRPESGDPPPPRLQTLSPAAVPNP
jgi:hypothetical protein